ARAMRTRGAEMTAAEMPAAAARRGERRNEDGTGKRRRNGSTPNEAGHGLISCASVSRAGTISVQTERAHAALLQSTPIKSAVAMLQRKSSCCFWSREKSPPRHKDRLLVRAWGYGGRAWANGGSTMTIQAAPAPSAGRRYFAMPTCPQCGDTVLAP